jgi:hypothetical protein
VSVSGVTHTNVVQTGLEAYAVCNVEDAVPLYVGKVRADSRWLMQRYDAGGVMGYANPSNNPTVSSYTDAWTQRATLTYTTYDGLTGV